MPGSPGTVVLEHTHTDGVRDGHRAHVPGHTHSHRGALRRLWRLDNRPQLAIHRSKKAEPWARTVCKATPGSGWKHNSVMEFTEHNL